MDDFKEKENIDLSSDIQALQRLTEAAEKQRSNYQLLRKLRFIYHLLLLIKLVQNILKRTDKRRFEKLCEKLISRCRIPVEKL
jgi:molecular chaperone DnaK (HSP70)